MTPRSARAAPRALSRALDVRGGGIGSMADAAWSSYTTVLDEKPLITKMFTSLTGFVIGDLLAQSFVEKKGVKGLDWKRLTRMGSFGFLCHATTGHFFYNFLDSLLPAVRPAPPLRGPPLARTRACVIECGGGPCVALCLTVEISMPNPRSPNAENSAKT